jgi:hypothetical protein
VELPKIALARADAEHVWSGGINGDGDVGFYTQLERAPTNRRDVIERAGVFSPNASRTSLDMGWVNGPRPRAIVPIIPPKLRPKRSKIGNFHTLFEAEWAVYTPPAPVDPALLRHLGGDLYAVVATWDLTEVERAVLALRS